MKYCSNCGTQIISESKFCSGCGTQIAVLQNQQAVIISATSENKVETTTNRILLPDGGIYEGELIDGIANGFGKLIYPEPDGEPDYFNDWEKGLIYEGNFLNGKKHGFGKLYTEAYVYEGDWKYNQKSGTGKLRTQNNGGIITEYIGEFEDDKKTGKGILTELGDDVLNPYTFEGCLFQDEFRDGLFVGSYLGQPSTSYSIRYKGSFMNIPGVKIHLLGKFPAFDGELIFTWLETGESSKHIIEMGQCESYDLMMSDKYDEDDDEDDEDNYDYDDSPIKPKDGAGLR